jgi:putative flippase GtrA
VSRPVDHHGRGLVARLNGLRRSSAPHHQAMRFVLSGSTVAAVYLGLGLLFSGPVGMPIQIAIPVAYVLSVLLNYTLQRTFVFADRERFALEGRRQFVRYVGIGTVQYALTALATALLPDALGVSEQVVFVAVALIAAAVTFVLLRFVVFHAGH